MEIHRRTSAIRIDASPSMGDDAAPSRVNKTHAPPVKARSTTTTHNPYASPSTMTDVVLLRSIQFLILLFAAWFVYLIVVGTNPPSTTTPEDAVEASPVPPLRRAVSGVEPGDFAAAREKISRMREEFYVRYGGEDEARAMLGRGLLAFDKKKDADDVDGGGGGGGPIRSTADRFLGAIVRHEFPFPASSTSTSSRSRRRPEYVMAFAGYSVTVGRGNHLEESYPYVLGRILSPVLAMPPLGIDLVVRNSAIGGIPSFPYGWCLRNFLGEDADSVR